MHAGSLESTKEVQELHKAIAESNYCSFSSALQTCQVYRSSVPFFFAFLFTLPSSQSIRMQKELGHYPAILTSRLANNPYVYKVQVFSSVT